MVLWGQGDVHLQIALDRMRHRQNLTVVGHHAAVPYKETIRKGTQQHSRFKRQSGGHGQFADCTIEVGPLPRGSGFVFKDSVVGGAIPRNYIPAVEEGVVEALTHGPLEGRRSRKRCRNATRFCWSRSIWSKSRSRTRSPRACSGWSRGAAGRSS